MRERNELAKEQQKQRKLEAGAARYRKWYDTHKRKVEVVELDSAGEEVEARKVKRVKPARTLVSMMTMLNEIRSSLTWVQMPDTANSAAARAFQSDVAEASRPGGVAWRASRVGKHRGQVAKRAKRVNWFHPLLWKRINEEALRADFSARRTVTNLQIHDPVLFGSLRHGTIQKWFRKDKNGHYERSWSQHTLENVAQGHSTYGTGRVGVLTKYPALVKKMTVKLKEIRQSGIAVNRLLARTIMISMIKEEEPDLLQKMKCSEVSYMAFVMLRMLTVS
jgi:hypothetical protein